MCVGLETLLILTGTISPFVLAYACRDDQYEQRVHGVCVGLPKIGGTDGSRAYPPLLQSGAFCYTPLVARFIQIEG
jgi:hypothetical protein